MSMAPMGHLSATLREIVREERREIRRSEGSAMAPVDPPKRLAVVGNGGDGRIKNRADIVTSGEQQMAINDINFHELARRTGYARQHLSRVMSGRGGYSDACARAIAAALEMEIGDLVTYLESVRGCG